MGIIKNLQDFFSSKTKESTSPEQWKDLEQRSGRGQRGTEVEKVKVIPSKEEQPEQQDNLVRIIPTIKEQKLEIKKDQISFDKEENNKIYFNQEEDINFNNELLEDLQEEFLSERQLFAQLDRENYDETMLPGYQEDIAEKQYNHEMLEIESINNEIYKTEEYKKLISSYSIEYPEIGREIEKVHQAIHEGKDLTPYQDNIIDKYERFFSNLNEALNDLGLKSDGTYHTDCFEDVIKDRFNVLNQNLENKNLVNSVLNKTQEKTIPLPDNIYDFTIKGDIKEELLKGKGVIGNIKGTDYFIRLPNKDEKNKNNLQILSIEKAKEFGLLPKENKQQSKSIKI